MCCWCKCNELASAYTLTYIICNFTSYIRAVYFLYDTSNLYENNPRHWKLQSTLSIIQNTVIPNDRWTPIVDSPTTTTFPFDFLSVLKGVQRRSLKTPSPQLPYLWFPIFKNSIPFFSEIYGRWNIGSKIRKWNWPLSSKRPPRCTRMVLEQLEWCINFPQKRRSPEHLEENYAERRQSRKSLSHCDLCRSIGIPF